MEQLRVPSKPEVYFIKYKADKDHIHAAPVAPIVVQEPLAVASLPAAPLPLEEAPPAIEANDSYDLPLESGAPQQPSPVYGPATA